MHPQCLADVFLERDNPGLAARCTTQPSYRSMVRPSPAWRAAKPDIVEDVAIGMLPATRAPPGFRKVPELFPDRFGILLMKHAGSIQEGFRFSLRCARMFYAWLALHRFDKRHSGALQSFFESRTNWLLLEASVGMARLKAFRPLFSKKSWRRWSNTVIVCDFR